VGWFLPALLAVLIARWRFLFTPITADEGGYLAVGRAWGRGATLYRDVWVDRPQGLAVLFRIWNDIGLGSPVGVRILALVACLAGAAAAGCMARRLVGPGAAWPTALVVGILASVPQYEGFIANAELLSCAVGVIALATLVRASWGRSSPSLWGLASAGAIGMVALSIKQSAFDALVAGLALLTVSCLRPGWSRRDRLVAVPAVVAGAAVPLTAMMVHGAVTGWHRWWYAFAGYRLDQRSALRNADWDRYHRTAQLVMPKLWPALAICVLLIVWVVRRRQLGAASLLVVWSGLAVLAFLTGGQFFRHYWVIFAFPLGTACGVLVSLVPVRAVRPLALVGMLVVPTLSTLNAWAIPRSEVGRRLSDDSRLTRSEHIGQWFEDARRGDENIFALCASAALYGNVSTDPPYPYLWFALIPQVPGARDALIALFESDRAPTYVAAFQSARLCDPSGAVERALSERYRAIGSVDGLAIYRRNPGR
jgi:hypothetical protein